MQPVSAAASKLTAYCDALIEAGAKPGSHALRWRPFLSRSIVAKALAARGYELCEDGADHDPTLRRFFAAPATQGTPGTLPESDQATSQSEGRISRVAP